MQRSANSSASSCCPTLSASPPSHLFPWVWSKSDAKMTILQKVARRIASIGRAKLLLSRHGCETRHRSAGASPALLFINPFINQR